MSTDDASKVYGGQVADIIAGAARESSYQPATPVELFVRDRRAPQTLDDLEPIERLQLERMFQGEDLASVLREGIELELWRRLPDGAERAVHPQPVCR